MMNFLRKHMRKIFIVTILAFIGATFMGFGSYLFGPETDYKTAVVVNGEKIPVKLFNSIYNDSLERAQREIKDSLTEQQIAQIKVGIIQVLVQEEVFYQEAKKYAIAVSDEELKNDIRNSMLFRNSNAFDMNLYYNFLRHMRMSPKEYETLRKKQLASEKLKIILASSIKAFDFELDEAKKTDPDVTKDKLLQKKADYILNEWFANTIKTAKITTNETLMR
jgi:hypothetical protein